MWVLFWEILVLIVPRHAMHTNTDFIVVESWSGFTPMVVSVLCFWIDVLLPTYTSSVLLNVVESSTALLHNLTFVHPCMHT